MESVLLLDFEPQGDKNAHVSGFGVSSCPLEYGTRIGVFEQIVGGVNLEFGALRPCYFREIGLHKEGVVFSGAIDASLLLFARFSYGAEVGSLYLLMSALPLPVESCPCYILHGCVFLCAKMPLLCLILKYIIDSEQHILPAISSAPFLQRKKKQRHAH
jgi:hypothetical protein